MRLLFVCVGNSCRSQMAEGLAKAMGHQADSAGTHPASAIAPNAVTVLEARGIAIEGMQPKSVDGFSADDYDLVISMGCGVQCPVMRIDHDWGLEDPVGGPLSLYEATANEIQRRLNLL